MNCVSRTAVQMAEKPRARAVCLQSRAGGGPVARGCFYLLHLYGIKNEKLMQKRMTVKIHLFSLMIQLDNLCYN